MTYSVTLSSTAQPFKASISPYMFLLSLSINHLLPFLVSLSRPYFIDPLIEHPHTRTIPLSSTHTTTPAVFYNNPQPEYLLIYFCMCLVFGGFASGIVYILAATTRSHTSIPQLPLGDSSKNPRLQNSGGNDNSNPDRNDNPENAADNVEDAGDPDGDGDPDDDPDQDPNPDPDDDFPPPAINFDANDYWRLLSSIDPDLFIFVTRVVMTVTKNIMKEFRQLRANRRYRAAVTTKSLIPPNTITEHADLLDRSDLIIARRMPAESGGWIHWAVVTTAIVFGAKATLTKGNTHTKTILEALDVDLDIPLPTAAVAANNVKKDSSNKWNDKETATNDACHSLNTLLILREASDACLCIPLPPDESGDLPGPSNNKSQEVELLLTTPAPTKIKAGAVTLAWNTPLPFEDGEDLDLEHALNTPLPCEDDEDLDFELALNTPLPSEDDLDLAPCTCAEEEDKAFVAMWEEELMRVTEFEKNIQRRRDVEMGIWDLDDEEVVRIILEEYHEQERNRWVEMGRDLNDEEVFQAFLEDQVRCRINLKTGEKCFAM